MATERQKFAAKALLKNRGNVSKSMIEAGYSKRSANKPDVLTKSKGWAELMEQYFPDTKIANVLGESLDAVDKDGNPDWAAKLSGAEKTLRLKKKYPVEQTEVKVNFSSMSDEQLIAIVEEGKKLTKEAVDNV